MGMEAGEAAPTESEAKADLQAAPKVRPSSLPISIPASMMVVFCATLACGRGAQRRACDAQTMTTWTPPTLRLAWDVPKPSDAIREAQQNRCYFCGSFFESRAQPFRSLC